MAIFLHHIFLRQNFLGHPGVKSEVTVFDFKNFSEKSVVFFINIVNSIDFYQK